MKNLSINAALPPALAEISAGRDHVKTSEYAKAINRANQTIRALLCSQGHAFGIKPLKLGGRLLWPVSDIAALLRGEVAA